MIAPTNPRETLASGVSPSGETSTSGAVGVLACIKLCVPRVLYIGKEQEREDLLDFFMMEVNRFLSMIADGNLAGQAPYGESRKALREALVRI